MTAACSLSTATTTRGRIEHLNSSRGSLKRSYDGRGRIKRIEDGGLVWEVLEHSQAGRPEKIRTPYGVVAITYDDAGARRQDRGGRARPAK